MKAKPLPKSVDGYLSRVSEPALATLKKVRAAIRSVVPDEATEGISYGIPTFKYKGMLVSFAAFKNHCSFFPASYAVIRKFQKDLNKFEVAKGTIRFPLDKPLPATLVKKMVRARVAEKRLAEKDAK
jgi:uncharacterized protein YdhG (YjbR/CyaY superfamily)